MKAPLALVGLAVLAGCATTEELVVQERIAMETAAVQKDIALQPTLQIICDGECKGLNITFHDPNKKYPDTPRFTNGNDVGVAVAGAVRAGIPWVAGAYVMDRALAAAGGNNTTINSNTGNRGTINAAPETISASRARDVSEVANTTTSESHSTETTTTEAWTQDNSVTESWTDDNSTTEAWSNTETTTTSTVTTTLDYDKSVDIDVTQQGDAALCDTCAPVGVAGGDGPDFSPSPDDFPGVDFGPN